MPRLKAHQTHQSVVEAAHASLFSPAPASRRGAPCTLFRSFFRSSSSSSASAIALVARLVDSAFIRCGKQGQMNRQQGVAHDIVGARALLAVAKQQQQQQQQQQHAPSAPAHG